MRQKGTDDVFVDLESQAGLGREAELPTEAVKEGGGFIRFY